MGLFDKIKNKLDSGNDGGSPAGNYAFPPAQAPPPLEASLARYRRQRGINLGSWFVTESWLSTKLYASTAVDPKGSDFDLARGKDAKAAMEHHWDTWMTDDDWHWIKQRGFNSVRLPVSLCWDACRVRLPLHVLTARSDTTTLLVCCQTCFAAPTMSAMRTCTRVLGLVSSVPSIRLRSLVLACLSTFTRRLVLRTLTVSIARRDGAAAAAS